MINIVTVVHDFALYDRWITNNAYCNSFNLQAIDNRAENLPIPHCYNRYLNAYDYSTESWVLFCHEDFELRECITERVKSLPKGCLHGVVGSARKGIWGFGMQVTYGNVIEANKDGSGKEWRAAKRIKQPVDVDAFDCCALLAHSSLIEKYSLRFDERLEFDMYVEDFCASAKLRYGIRSIVDPIECCHHSGSFPTERLYRHLPYLKRKYPDCCFIGPLTYFGTPRWQKRLQDSVVGLLRRLVR